MPDRRPRPDDARPIPQQGRPQPSDADDGADDGADDIYTVDTRVRRPARRTRPARDERARSAPAEAQPPTRRLTAQPDGVRTANRDQPRRRPAPPRSAVGDGPDGHGPGGPRRPDASRPRQRLRWGRLLAALVILWLAFLVVTPFHAWSNVSRVDAAPDGQRPADTDGHTYLLVGSDSREDLTAAERSELGTGNVEGKRTDSIILVHAPSGGGKSVLISIPRDSFVPIPGHGSNKVNAAYSIGGPKLLVETLEQVSNLRIDGYLEIGLGGFAAVVDSLGGVDICVPFDMDDPKAHINLKKGCQNLDGKNALGFVRARYSDPRGDIGRAERQRQFLAAIMKGAANPSTVVNPFRYWSFTHTAAGAVGVGVGEGTSLRDASRILLTMRGASDGSTLSLVVPLQSTNYPTRAGIAVKWDTERAQALFTALRENQPLEAPPAGTDGVPSGR